MTIERMKRWVIAMLLCGLCHTAAFAFQYDRNSQIQAWGYQPVYTNPTVPTYEFYSTTPGAKSIMESKSKSYVRKEWPATPGEEDDPSGVVPDPTPIGDAPWWMMFLLAAAYSAFRYRKKSLT